MKQAKGQDSLFDTEPMNVKRRRRTKAEKWCWLPADRRAGAHAAEVAAKRIHDRVVKRYLKAVDYGETYGRMLQTEMLDFEDDFGDTFGESYEVVERTEMSHLMRSWGSDKPLWTLRTVVEADDPSGDETRFRLATFAWTGGPVGTGGWHPVRRTEIFKPS